MSNAKVAQSVIDDVFGMLADGQSAVGTVTEKDGKAKGNLAISTKSGQTFNLDLDVFDNMYRSMVNLWPVIRPLKEQLTVKRVSEGAAAKAEAKEKAKAAKVEERAKLKAEKKASREAAKAQEKAARDEAKAKIQKLKDDAKAAQEKAKAEALELKKKADAEKLAKAANKAAAEGKLTDAKQAPAAPAKAPVKGSAKK